MNHPVLVPILQKKGEEMIIKHFQAIIADYEEEVDTQESDTEVERYKNGVTKGWRKMSKLFQSYLK